MDQDVEKASSHTAGVDSPRPSIERCQSNNGYGVSCPARQNAAPDATLPGKDEDYIEVGWDGGDADPLCPRSYSKARKWLITCILSFGSFTVTNTSSIYSATYGQMQKEFGNSTIVSTVGLSTFVLGISFGPMLLGPMSEFYGRRPIYIISWLMFIIWIIPEAVAKNITTIIVARFFDGFAGSSFLAVAGGTVGDIFQKHELQAPMALYAVAPFMGPTMGPLVGGFINYNTNWRWTYYVLIIWSFITWLAIIFLVPETYHPILLREKAKKLREETGDNRYQAPSERVQKSVAKSLGLSLLRPFQLLIFEPMCTCLCILSAILLGILYLFFGAFPLVFKTNYGFNLWQIGLAFIGIGVGMLIGIATDPIWHRVRQKLTSKLEAETGIAGNSEPEFRLPPTIAGALVAPIGVFIFAWTSYAHVHWIGPIIGSAIFGTGILLVYTGIFTYFVDAYPLYAASALAANAFVRCLFAAAFPLFGNHMYKQLGFRWASTLLAFLLLIMAPFPYIFFRYGKKLRARSRFAKD